MFKIEGLGDLQEIIKGRDDYQPYPKVDDRHAWEAISESLKRTILDDAKSYLNYEGPLPKASQMMDFMRTGNRSEYQERSHEQRRALLALVFGECIENEGRFIDDIINIIWQLCEQTTWVLPAHYSLFNREGIVGMLPDVRDQVIDLFAGEVAVLLSYTYYLMKPVLDKITPAICQRIAYELERRIIEPFIHRKDFWWMGFSGRSVNNWAPWCTSNCLMTTMLIEIDSSKRAEVVKKALQIMEKFTDVYHEDGGCDEGTSYWDRAGGSLFDCLEILHEWSDRKINFYHKPLIKNIGDYIYKSHIDDNYFVNFADGAARVHLESLLVYQYGKRVQSEELKRVAATVHTRDTVLNPVNSGVLRALPYLFRYQEFGEYASQLGERNVQTLDHVLDGIQMVTYREHNQSNQGLFLAVKGGHNDESHNHNDIGQYVVYKDGYPIIIDAGCGVYTRKTFSSKRYEIWTMQSSFHNLPEINGIMQAYGAQYRPTDVAFHTSEIESSMTLNIAGAYPPEAKVLEWNRTCRLKRQPRGQIIIEDKCWLEDASQDIQNIMMTCCNPVVNHNLGIVTLEYAMGKEATISYDHEQLDVICETIQLDDENLSNIWGTEIYRLLFRVREEVTRAICTYLIQ